MIGLLSLSGCQLVDTLMGWREEVLEDKKEIVQWADQAVTHIKGVSQLYSDLQQQVTIFKDLVNRGLHK